MSFIDTMISYFSRGETVESVEKDPWEESPFCRIDRLQGQTGAIPEKALQASKTVYGRVERRGEVDHVKTSWFTIKDDNIGYDIVGFYRNVIAPTVATADNVKWTGSVSMDLTEAPPTGSDAWKQQAAQFQLSSVDERDMVHSKIRCMYSELRELTERNDCHRGVHSRELRNAGPQVKNRAFNRALDRLYQFDGVTPPADGKPAWVWTDTETPETDPATTTGEV